MGEEPDFDYLAVMTCGGGRIAFGSFLNAETAAEVCRLNATQVVDLTTEEEWAGTLLPDLSPAAPTSESCPMR